MLSLLCGVVLYYVLKSRCKKMARLIRILSFYPPRSLSREGRGKTVPYDRYNHFVTSLSRKLDCFFLVQSRNNRQQIKAGVAKIPPTIKQPERPPITPTPRSLLNSNSKNSNRIGPNTNTCTDRRIYHPLPTRQSTTTSTRYCNCQLIVLSRRIPTTNQKKYIL